MHKESNITAYVVGYELDDIDATSKKDSGVIYAVTFGQLIQTSKDRLFRLRESLKEHYESIGTETIVDKALKQPHQIKIDL